MRGGCNCRHFELDETVLVLSNMIVFDTISAQPTLSLYTATLTPALSSVKRETPIISRPENIRRLLAHSIDGLSSSVHRTFRRADHRMVAHAY